MSVSLEANDWQLLINHLHGCNYFLLKASLLIAKRKIPNPSMMMVTGQGNGHPNKGLGMPTIISIASKIKSRLAIMRIIFEALSIIFHLNSFFCFKHKTPPLFRNRVSIISSWHHP